MRESIGGTWLFSIVITFIALFSIFLSFAIKYTVAFNYKNQILNFIERAEGWTASDIDDLENASDAELNSDPSVQGKAYVLAESLGYDYQAVKGIMCGTISEQGHEDVEVKEGGYCVTKYCPAAEGYLDTNTNNFVITEGANHKTYYKVTTFISIPFSLFDMTLTIPITGETSTLFYDEGNLDCHVN